MEQNRILSKSIIIGIVVSLIVLFTTSKTKYFIGSDETSEEIYEYSHAEMAKRTTPDYNYFFAFIGLIGGSACAYILLSKKK
ncbi:hypothetical protein [Elizabethkingia meningoseptica]|uniref:hypothetical protein n=1 Tax=Elizabethkingia meningoseptica TaxID=238 RepID=UPI0038922302